MHPRNFFLTSRRSFFRHQEPSVTTAPLSPGCPWNGLPGGVPVEPASVGLFKSCVNKLPLT
nr:unnamed protein product [Callosobruchus chinensis]